MSGIDMSFTPLWHADEKLMPLLGKRIMITAPRQYATKLASCLIAAGARPVWLPSITITHITRQNLSAVSNSCCSPLQVPLSLTSVTQTLASFSIQCIKMSHSGIAIVLPFASPQQWHASLLPPNGLARGAGLRHAVMTYDFDICEHVALIEWIGL